MAILFEVETLSYLASPRGGAAKLKDNPSFLSQDLEPRDVFSYIAAFMGTPSFF